MLLFFPRQNDFIHWMHCTHYCTWDLLFAILRPLHLCSWSIASALRLPLWLRTIPCTSLSWILPASETFQSGASHCVVGLASRSFPLRSTVSSPDAPVPAPEPWRLFPATGSKLIRRIRVNRVAAWCNIYKMWATYTATLHQNLHIKVFYSNYN